jgi:DNA-directed RNA polymerase specialized sigma24 family protein
LNKEDFANIYSQCYRQLFNYAIQLVKNIEDAEDLVQDAFLKQIQYNETKNIECDNDTMLEYLKRTILQLFITKYNKGTK